MTVTEKSTPNGSSPSENGPRHLENAPKDSKTLVVCFCVAILGSQLLLIYNVSILSGEINRFDTWMKHFNEELVVLSSSLTSGWSSIESRLKTKVSRILSFAIISIYCDVLQKNDFVSLLLIVTGLW